MAQQTAQIEKTFALAAERYAEEGVDVGQALDRLVKIPVSLQCWQGDDVGGFEPGRGALGGGLAATGNYPGKARNAVELRADVEQAAALIPGPCRLNLHATYAESPPRGVDRDALEPGHFQSWIDWSRSAGMPLDLNPTFFSHPLASSGLTLSHPDAAVRQFWIRHGQAVRRIGAAMGAAQGSPCITNVWIPDGYKDTPADRKAPRQRLAEALDEVFAEALDEAHNLDAIEGKLFGLGSESYVVGSHEFYLGYAITRKKMLCLDTGHFHPTETVSDKISAVMPWIGRMFLHVSRGVRWDSDHVVTLGDDLLAIAHELVRGDYLSRVSLGLDYFDASINRAAAWVIGARALQQALLIALLEPTAALRNAENSGQFTHRLARMEANKMLPWAAVWNFHCHRFNVPGDADWMNQIEAYERTVQLLRE